VFEVSPEADLGVSADRVVIDLIVKSDEGGIVRADESATNQIADQLRNRLGTRSICL
jgi:hypothetical protein